MKTISTFFLLLLTQLSFAQCDTKLLLNTMPKSGSLYIWTTMQQILAPLGYTDHRISKSSFPIDQVIGGQVTKHDHFITQEHIDASSFNRRMLKACLPKFLLHLRDPRQVVLSWLYYIETNYQPQLWSREITPPPGYFCYTLEEKINWQIEHFLPALVRWIQQWEVSIDSGEFDILVTTYEEMVKDQEAFFNKVFVFFRFKPEELSISSAIKKPDIGKSHFRKGQVDEWKKVMSQAQIDRMHEIIPMDMLKRFGWE